MIRLYRRREAGAVPAAFKTDKLRRKAEELVDIYYKARDAGRPMAFDAGAWKPAKSFLKKDTGGKCAYCEASTDTVAYGDVEHFRPKSVYWWLAFCFDNYLFSCQICNQAYKLDNFPVGAARLDFAGMPAARPAGAALDDLVSRLMLDALTLDDVALAALWGGEDAGLVNPYLEDPSRLFAYEVDPGNEEIWLRSAGTPRADRALAAAESCLGLNRQELRRERHHQYLNLLICRKMLALAPPGPDQEFVLDQVGRLQDRHQPFAGMLRWFAAQWGLAEP